MTHFVLSNARTVCRVADEADALLPSGIVGPSTYGELAYAKLVVRESLRMFPSLPLTVRSLEKEVTLAGKYTIPKVRAYARIRLDSEGVATDTIKNNARGVLVSAYACIRACKRK